MDDFDEDKKNESLTLKEKLTFFFIPFLLITTVIGADFKALSYEKKEKQKWNYIGAGFLFYAILATLYVRLSIISE